MEGLDGILSTVLDAGDAGTAAPPEAPVTDSAAGNSPVMPESSPEAQSEETPFRWDNVPPELEPLAKGFQADYTRKAQELAEQRKAVEAAQQRYAAYEQLERLQSEDPGLYAQLLRQQADLFGGRVQAGATETDPYAQIEPVTEGERFALEQLREINARMQRQEQFIQDQQLRQQRDAIQAEYAALGRQIGRELTQAEQQEIATFAVQNNIPSISFAYRAMRYESDIEAARRAGMNAGAQVVQQKVTAGPAPSGVADRSGAVPETPKNLDALTAAIATELGI